MSPPLSTRLLMPVLVVAGLVLAAGPVLAEPDESRSLVLLCVNGDGEDARLVEVVSEGPNRVPCATWYTKWGKRTQKADAANAEGYCESVAARIQGNLEAAGFACQSEIDEVPGAHTPVAEVTRPPLESSAPATDVVVAPIERDASSSGVVAASTEERVSSPESAASPAEEPTPLPDVSSPPRVASAPAPRPASTGVSTVSYEPPPAPAIPAEPPPAPALPAEPRPTTREVAAVSPARVERASNAPTPEVRAVEAPLLEERAADAPATTPRSRVTPARLRAHVRAFMTERPGCRADIEGAKYAADGSFGVVQWSCEIGSSGYASHLLAVFADGTAPASLRIGGPLTKDSVIDAIDDAGRVQVMTKLYRPDDPECCPSVRSVDVYRVGRSSGAGSIEPLID